MKSAFNGLVIAVLALTAGCIPPPKSGKGFTLPDGDAKKGEAAFVSLRCNACHKIDDVEQFAVEGAKPELSIALGGEVARIGTYGELVTSIINPSHRLARQYPKAEVAVEGDSKMTNYNDVLTVAQLTDLVAFLQSKYTIREYEPTPYPIYSY